MSTEEIRYYTKQGIFNVDFKSSKEVNRNLLIPVLLTNEKSGCIDLFWKSADGKLHTFFLCTLDELMGKNRKTYPVYRHIKSSNEEEFAIDVGPRHFSVLFVGKAVNWSMPEKDNERYAQMNNQLKDYARKNPKKYVAYVAAPILQKGSSAEGVRKILPLFMEKESESVLPQSYCVTKDRVSNVEKHWRLQRGVIF